MGALLSQYTSSCLTHSFITLDSSVPWDKMVCYVNLDSNKNEVVEIKQRWRFYILPVYDLNFLILPFEKIYDHEPSSLPRRMSSTLSVATTSEQKR